MCYLFGIGLLNFFTPKIFKYSSNNEMFEFFSMGKSRLDTHKQEVDHIFCIWEMIIDLLWCKAFKGINKENKD